MDLTNNYYQVFNLPENYQVDEAVLKQHYRELQKQCHPDKFVGQSAQQQRIAEQYTTFINQAYATLLSPTLRAQYLLTLRGVDNSFDNITHQDTNFLMEQMQLHESLAEVEQSENPSVTLDALTKTMQERFKQLQIQFTEYFESKNYKQACEVAAKMHFFNRLQQQIEQLEEQLDLL